jgi:hypothetical protein
MKRSSRLRRALLPLEQARGTTRSEEEGLVRQRVEVAPAGDWAALEDKECHLVVPAALADVWEVEALGRPE